LNAATEDEGSFKLRQPNEDHGCGLND